MNRVLLFQHRNFRPAGGAFCKFSGGEAPDAFCKFSGGEAPDDELLAFDPFDSVLHS